MPSRNRIAGAPSGFWICLRQPADPPWSTPGENRRPGHRRPCQEQRTVIPPAGTVQGHGSHLSGDMVHTFRIPFGETAMPWQETDRMFERHHFAQDLASGQWTMTELCSRYGRSRNTGYKWRERFRSLGVRGLEEHSRAACAAIPPARRIGPRRARAPTVTDVPAAPKAPERDRRYAAARDAALARSAIAPYVRRIVERPRLKFLNSRKRPASSHTTSTFGNTRAPLDFRRGPSSDSIACTTFPWCIEGSLRAPRFVAR
jgi:hypothetical protein